MYYAQMHGTRGVFLLRMQWAYYYAMVIPVIPVITVTVPVLPYHVYGEYFGIPWVFLSKLK
jgi:hypothetical protein